MQGCPNLTPIQTFNLGWLYGRAHDFKTALKIFQSVTPDVPDRATHQYVIALSEFELSDYRDAVDALKEMRSQGCWMEKAKTTRSFLFQAGSLSRRLSNLKEELQQNTNYALPNTTVQSETFGLITSAAGQGREVQFALKVIS